MNTEQLSGITEYLIGLPERQLWEILEEYFTIRDVRVDVVHSTSEHGTDVLVHVDREKDFLGQGYNVLIQAKTGNLSLPRCREVLCQMFEMPYFTLEHPLFHDSFPRRIVLVVAGDVLPEARASLKEFNNKHDFNVELIDLTGLIRVLDEEPGYIGALLTRSRGVGQVSAEHEVEPPTVGEAGIVDADEETSQVVGG